jgi:hypothetical protein
VTPDPRFVGPVNLELRSASSDGAADVIDSGRPHFVDARWSLSVVDTHGRPPNGVPESTQKVYGSRRSPPRRTGPGSRRTCGSRIVSFCLPLDVLAIARGRQLAEWPAKNRFNRLRLVQGASPSEGAGDLPTASGKPGRLRACCARAMLLSLRLAGTPSHRLRGEGSLSAS